MEISALEGVQQAGIMRKIRKRIREQERRYHCATMWNHRGIKEVKIMNVEQEQI